jgi:hypothetical protein
MERVTAGTNLDEIHITSIVRVLLEMSSGRADVNRSPISNENTGSRIIRLCASLLSITQPTQFGAIDYAAIYNTLSEYPLMPSQVVRAKDLGHQIKLLRESLLGLPEGYLVGVLYSTLLDAYMSRTSRCRY